MIHKKIPIWREGEYQGADPSFTPWMDTYILSHGEAKGGVLIFPGGGYQITSPREAEPVALWLSNAGYNAFVLYYSVAPNRHPQPLKDATRALCLIRDNAKEWKTPVHKVAVCGFSAGGHLAASIGVHYEDPALARIEGMAPGKNRPDAMILCYPVISGGDHAHKGSYENLLGERCWGEERAYHTLEKHVTENTPPAFLWTTFNDASVPVENSLLFADALRKNNVPFSLHVFPDGQHGLSLCDERTWENTPPLVNETAGQWRGLCEDWLKKTL